jgi:parvulin-like peptidyl-prolyl isomerase
MKPILLAATLGCAPLIAAAATAGGDSGTVYAYLARDGGTFKAPLFAAESENLPVAKIDDEVVKLRELTLALAGAHGGRTSDKQAGKKDFTAILDRIIDARLLAREARQMGMADLPEFKASVEAYGKQLGLELLQGQAVQAIKADPAEVEAAYRQAVREWRVRSVLVSGEAVAKDFAAQARKGGKFQELAKKLVADKKAKGGEEPQSLTRATALPEVVAAVEKLAVGGVSAPVKLKDGFAVMKLEEIRYPEDPKARADAEQSSLEARRKAALKKYYDGLVKRYARTDQALLKSIDLEAKKPGLKALEKDQRVICRIQGADSITVAELAKAVEAGFFHGAESAIKEKRVNPQKLPTFDGLLSQRIVPLEVKRLGIDQSSEFKARVAVQETSTLFTMFMEKVVFPQIKVTDEDLKKHYSEHKKDYLYPTFYKVESLAFTTLPAAESAVKQLRAGTDYKWLVTNADGQVKASERALAIEGTLAATALPKDVASVLSGAKKGDYRLHADDARKQYYAIRVLDVVGATEQPFEEVKEGIQQKLMQERVSEGIAGFAAKVRKASDIKIFLTRIGD